MFVSRTDMKNLFSISSILYFIFSLLFLGCSSNSTSKSTSIQTDTLALAKQNRVDLQNSSIQNDELIKIYSQAIGNYIKLVNEKYKLTFDTLYFGKHHNGQSSDFPDITLPSTIENTQIKLVPPEQGEKIQEKRKTSFYVNLFGTVDFDKADFIFVTFSNGLAHQFDCFITYKFNAIENKFVLEATRFENYRYK
jgi:hypothetical protein